MLGQMFIYNLDVQIDCDCRNASESSACNITMATACDSNPCLNGGQCQVTGDSSFTCVCPAGYYGRTCAMKPAAVQCQANPCQSAVVCSYADSAGIECGCLTPSPPCPEPCSPNPCQNGGSCTNVDAGQFRCSCPSGYYGRTCSLVAAPVGCRVPQCGQQCSYGVESALNCNCLGQLTHLWQLIDFIFT